MKPNFKPMLTFFLIVVLPIASVTAGAIFGWKAHLASIKQKERMGRIMKIDSLISEVNNGKKESYFELYNFLVANPLMPNDENQKIQQAFVFFQKSWSEDFSMPLINRFVETETNSTRNWSMEYLYYVLIGKNAYWNSLNIRKAVLNEIALRGHEYFVGTLIEMANETNEIPIAINISRTICILTNYAPYKSNEKYRLPAEQLAINDVPKFEQLNKWWKNKGSNESRYNCPFGSIIELDRNYFSIHFNASRNPLNDNITKSRLEFLKEISEKYQKLSLSHAEYAYWLIPDQDSHQRIHQLLKLSKANGEEGLPWIIQAYLAFSTKDYDTVIKSLIEAENRIGEEGVISTIQFNEYLKPFLNFAAQYFMKKRDNGYLQ